MFKKITIYLFFIISVVFNVACDNNKNTETKPIGISSGGFQLILTCEERKKLIIQLYNSKMNLLSETDKKEIINALMQRNPFDAPVANVILKLDDEQPIESQWEISMIGDIISSPVEKSLMWKILKAKKISTSIEYKGKKHIVEFQIEGNLPDSWMYCEL